MVSTQSSYGLEDVRKITFDGDLMNLHLLDGSLYTWNVSTILNVSFNLPKANDMSIALYDLQGKVVLEKQLGTKAMGNYQELLDISALPNGLYVCRISGEQNSITKQIIKK